MTIENKDYHAAEIRKILTTLTPREEKVLRMRFGIGEELHTVEEVGKHLGISTEHVRQIEEKAHKKLIEKGPPSVNNQNN